MALSPSAAQAQSDRTSYAFSIPPEPAAEALIAFAIQANISIGGVNACQGASPGLKGRYTIEDGLSRLLAKAGCDFRRAAPDTVQVFAARPRPAAGRPQDRAKATPTPTPVPPPLELPDISQVVVTTTKRAALMGSLPYTIDALNHQQLVEAGAQDVNDVALQIAGLSTTNLGLGLDKIMLRGLSDGVFTGRTQSTVGIYLDDVPITYDAPDPDLQLADVEAIEVLQGPQGALYGGGAMSGIYRIVTQKPSLDSWSSYARIGGSLTDGGAPSQEYEGMLNVPLRLGQLGVRAVAYETIDGGYIDNTTLRLSNVDQTVREGARVTVRAALESNWLVTASMGYQGINDADAQYVTASGGRLHRANQVLESSRNNFAETALGVEHGDAWGEFKSTTSFVQHKFSSQYDASNALPLFGLGTPSVGSYREPIDIQMLTEDMVFTSPNIGRFQWLAGVHGSATWETTDSTVRAGVAPISGAPAGSPTVPAETLYSEHRTDQRTAGGAYFEGSYALTDALTARAGLRLSTSTTDTTSLVLAPQQNQSVRYSGRTIATGPTPEFSLSYKLAENENVYALVSEGRRSGGINTGGPIGTVFATSPNLAGPHRLFGGDELWNFETGTKLSFLGGRLEINADLFYDLWSDIQTDQFLASGISYTANAGDGRNPGAEMELVARPLAGFTLQGTALIDRPELTHANPGFEAGASLPGVPDVSLSGRATYRWPLWWNMNALVFAETQYVGRSHVTFSPVSPTQGGYVLTRLSAQLERDNWRMAFFLSNPTNARANTFAYGNPFDFQQAQQVTPERPLTLRAILSKQF